MRNLKVTNKADKMYMAGTGSLDDDETDVEVRIVYPKKSPTSEVFMSSFDLFGAISADVTNNSLEVQLDEITEAELKDMYCGVFGLGKNECCYIFVPKSYFSRQINESQKK